MKLLELFQKKGEFELTKQSSSRFQTKAKINNRVIVFDAVENVSNDAAEWDISFGEIIQSKKYATAELTGSGGELEVLAMVKDSILEFIKRYHPNAIHFTAAKEDRARASVYERMLKRLMPSGWEFSKDDTKDDYDVFFTLRKAT